MVIDYYQQLGHQVVSFIPDYYIQPKEVAKKQRLVEKGLEMRANGKRRKIQVIHFLISDPLHRFLMILLSSSSTSPKTSWSPLPLKIMMIAIVLNMLNNMMVVL